MGSCVVPRGDVSLTTQSSREEWELEVVLVSGVLPRKQDPKNGAHVRGRMTALPPWFCFILLCQKVSQEGVTDAASFL